MGLPVFGERVAFEEGDEDDGDEGEGCDDPGDCYGCADPADAVEDLGVEQQEEADLEPEVAG